MIKKGFKYSSIISSLILLGTLLFPADGWAQFIDLHLEVDSELTATTEKALDFGTITTNTGRRMIEFGSINMGIFSITGLEDQVLLINLYKPDRLLHDNPAINDIVPVELFARYGYSSQDYQNSMLLPEATSQIKVERNSDPGPWNTIYIFMFGSIDIGNVSDGVYSNEIVLNVEYI